MGISTHYSGGTYTPVIVWVCIGTEVYNMIYDMRGIEYSTNELFQRVGICDLNSAVEEPYRFFV